MKSWTSELMLLLMTLIWGATFLFTKIGLESTGPYFYLVLRFGLAVALVLVFFGHKLNLKDTKLLKQGLILGTLYGVGFILQTLGLQHTTVQKSAFITGLAVVMTPFTTKIISNKKVQLFSKFAVVIAFIGLYLFANPDFSDINKGDLLTFFSTFCWAIFIPTLDKFTYLNETKNLTYNLVFIQLFVMFLCGLVGFFIFESHNFYVNFNYKLIESIAFNGIVASFILMFIQTNFQKNTTPVKAAIIFSLEPLFATLFAYIAFHEILNDRETLGAIIIFCGALTSELGLPITNFIKRSIKN